MLVKLAEELLLNAPIGQVWELLRDTRRLTGLLPGVESVERLFSDENEAYAARVTDKIGPFKITMKLEVRITGLTEPSVLKAALRGSDTMRLNHMTGSMQVALQPAASGTQMRFEASIEVLGPLATLGAVPIRRRTTELFAKFAKNVQGEFAAEPGSMPDSAD